MTRNERPQPYPQPDRLAALGVSDPNGMLDERLNAELEMFRKRKQLLSYIHDIRQWLRYDARAGGSCAQSYRDRWSMLCKQLCAMDGGKPCLVVYDNPRWRADGTDLIA